MHTCQAELSFLLLVFGSSLVDHNPSHQSDICCTYLLVFFVFLAIRTENACLITDIIELDIPAHDILIRVCHNSCEICL